MIAENLMLEEQSGFRKGRSCADNTFVIKQIIEKHRESNKETHMAFIDLEKAFDRVDRHVLWNIMRDRGYPQQLIQTVQSLYYRTRIAVKNEDKISETILTDQGVRQGCSLSPTLFNIYIDDLIRKWKKVVDPGLKISQGKYLNALLYADDVIIIQNAENKLQRSIHKLNDTCKEYNMRISIAKTKVMAFRGLEPIRTKIAIENKCIEQINKFNYLGNSISYDKECDVDNKLQKFQRICGTINQALKNKARRETKMKFYKVMAEPTLSYGSELWTVTKKQESKIQASEMKFLRQVKGCTRQDRIRNEEIRGELDIYNMNQRLKNYKQQWWEHIERMDDTRLPKIIRQYKPLGRRSVGRPRGRWDDDLKVEDFEGGTGILPTP